MNKKRILLIEDNIFEQKQFQKVLEKENYIVNISINGDGILDTLQSNHYDLVLLDIMLGKKLGTDILKIIRKTYDGLQLPVIMATSKQDRGDIIECFKLGANDYIIKPIDFVIALSRINIQIQLTELAGKAKKLEQIQSIQAIITTYNHEINNPLTIALGHLDILENTKDLNKIENIRKALYRIESITKRIASLSENNLEFLNYSNDIGMINLDKISNDE